MLKEKILFIDIETAALVYDYEQLGETAKALWDRKWQFQKETDAKQQYQKAGIYAEFAKVICIGYLYQNDGKWIAGSIAGDEEGELLRKFSELIRQLEIQSSLLLCAHNGKEFDFPFLGRRYLINGIKLPNTLNLQGRKPWEVKHLDTLELWKFGDYKNYTSLDLLAHVFGIPSPKSDLDGSKVGEVYHVDKDLPRIQRYCLQDVLTLARVYARFSGLSIPNDDQIIFV
jgi:hypothetical protein